MSRKLMKCTIAILATLIVAACERRVEFTVDPQLIEAMRELQLLQRMQGVPPGAPNLRRRCTVFLEIYEFEDGHLVNGQVIRMHGPINEEGDYRLQAMPSPSGVAAHPWDDTNPYKALSTTTSGEDFKSNVLVNVSPHVSDPHIYDITIEDRSANGCPSQVLFETEFDTDSEGNDHGGHARGKD